MRHVLVFADPTGKLCVLDAMRPMTMGAACCVSQNRAVLITSRLVVLAKDWNVVLDPDRIEKRWCTNNPNVNLFRDFIGKLVLSISFVMSIPMMYHELELIGVTPG